MTDFIRNFVIIAHIDHGKSTLADRLLEVTKTVEPRRMKSQYLDQMALERERGITIKMSPVRMHYTLDAIPYILNLIDTPGHSDFAYEVSRALRAVEGAVLLVDATQGIQAQTLSNFENAKEAGLVIIGAVNKIDLNPPRLQDIVVELADLLNCLPDDILLVSGKTGEGVDKLLSEIIRRIPSPTVASKENVAQALIFDSRYDDHKGVIAFVRVKNGFFEAGKEYELVAAAERFKAKEVGYFRPALGAAKTLQAGEIGYIATGIKSPGKIRIGDTISIPQEGVALLGYAEPRPVVFVTFYPSEENDYEDLKRALEELKLSDSALQFEPEVNEVLGRGFTCGFLGRLHFEIIAERLKREFGLSLVSSFPSVTYRVREGTNWRLVRHPKDFPDYPDEVFQPMAEVEIITPPEYLGEILKLKEQFRISDILTETLGLNILLRAKMPLGDLIRNFDDTLKSLSAGYASLSYKLAGEAPARVIKLEILVAGELIPGLTRIVAEEDMEREGRMMVERLKELLPRQQFAQALQARARGRIIARENIPALRKDVTGYLYGGDRTRKMKLWKKQKRGKEKLKKLGRVALSPEIFRELLKQ